MEEKIVSVTLNLSNYVTQKELKNLTKVDTYDFALKSNVAKIKKRVDGIDANKINSIYEIQGRNYVKDSYLYLNQEYEYFEIDKANLHKILSWKSAGISDEKLESPEDKNVPKIFFEEIWPYLKNESFRFLAQKKISYTHKSIVNIYIVYLMPYITDAKGNDLMKYGLFGATAYNSDKKLVGYDVGFGTQKYTHDDDKEARNLVIIGVNSPDPNNALALGKGSIKVTTNDSVAVQAKDKLKTNCTIPDKKFVLSVHYNATDDNSESFLFINGVEEYKFKVHKNENIARKLNLGGISDNSVFHYSHTLNGNIIIFL